MRRFALFLAIALPLAGCGASGEAKVTVDNAWVRLPAVPGNPAAAYFDLHGGAKETELAGIESPQAERIELHESMSHGGMTRMAPLKSVRVPPGEWISFRPAGRHAMLFEIARDVPRSRSLTLRFRFADGKVIETQALAIGAGEPEPMFVSPAR
jgi:periplasmic copper chaperone A